MSSSLMPSGGAAAQQWLDDAPHAGLAELVDELVEMSVAPQDKTLARFLDGVERDRPAAVSRGLVLEAGFVGQRVHQPGLAAGQFPDCRQDFMGDGLAGLLGVLAQQVAHLPLREVAQAQGLGLDIEGAAAEHDIPCCGADAVVAHVAHAAQNDALREVPRSVAVPAAQLPEHRDRGVAHEGVDLVDEQHQRLRISRRPFR